MGSDVILKSLLVAITLVLLTGGSLLLFLGVSGLLLPKTVRDKAPLKKKQQPPEAVADSGERAA